MWRYHGGQLWTSKCFSYEFFVSEDFCSIINIWFIILGWLLMTVIFYCLVDFNEFIYFCIFIELNFWVVLTCGVQMWRFPGWACSSLTSPITLFLIYLLLLLFISPVFILLCEKQKLLSLISSLMSSNMLNFILIFLCDFLITLSRLIMSWI